jgi:hypothetical protein
VGQAVPRRVRARITHPESFNRLGLRIRELVTAWQGIAPEPMKAIAAPTPFIVGDSDAITIDHTIAMWPAVPRAKLAVFPGTAHWPGMMNRSDWPPAMVPAFLDSPQP